MYSNPSKVSGNSSGGSSFFISSSKSILDNKSKKGKEKNYIMHAVSYFPCNTDKMCLLRFVDLIDRQISQYY